MFKFIKDKLKEQIAKFSKKVKEEKAEVPEIKKIEESPSIEKRETKEKPDIEPIKTQIIDEEIKTKPEEEKKGFFGKVAEKITTRKIDEKEFDEFFQDLEMALMENNVAMEVIDKIKDDLKTDLVNKPLKRSKIEDIIKDSLKKSIEELFSVDTFDMLKRIREKKPFVICFVGINGSGKTTTIAKVAKMLLDDKLSVVLAASDTFRAASIEQLQLHADKLGVKMIKHTYGADPAAVAYDAIEHAKAKKIDVVLIDTAGRMHSNQNLQDEMKKIVRVAKPDLKIFVGESITGNDCVEQAKQFNEAIGIDGIILAKADIDEKGGAAVSISYVTKKPILYLGTGQEYDKLEKFDSEIIIKGLGIY